MCLRSRLAMKLFPQLVHSSNKPATSTLLIPEPFASAMRRSRSLGESSSLEGVLTRLAVLVDGPTEVRRACEAPRRDVLARGNVARYSG